MNGKLSLLPLAALTLAIARADITPVDATHGAAGNTHATGGPPAQTGWLDATSNSATANPSQWVLRTRSYRSPA